MNRSAGHPTPCSLSGRSLVETLPSSTHSFSPALECLHSWQLGGEKSMVPEHGRFLLPILNLIHTSSTPLFWLKLTQEAIANFQKDCDKYANMALRKKGGSEQYLPLWYPSVKAVLILCLLPPQFWNNYKGILWVMHIKII